MWSRVVTYWIEWASFFREWQLYFTVCNNDNEIKGINRESLRRRTAETGDLAVGSKLHFSDLVSCGTVADSLKDVRLLALVFGPASTVRQQRELKQRLSNKPLRNGLRDLHCRTIVWKRLLPSKRLAKRLWWILLTQKGLCWGSPNHRHLCRNLFGSTIRVTLTYNGGTSALARFSGRSRCSTSGFSLQKTRQVVFCQNQFPTVTPLWFFFEKHPDTGWTLRSLEMAQLIALKNWITRRETFLECSFGERDLQSLHLWRWESQTVQRISVRGSRGRPSSEKKGRGVDL